MAGRWVCGLWRIFAVLLVMGAMLSTARGAVLTVQGLFNSGLAGAEPLAVSPDSQWAYVGSSTSGELAVLRRDATGSFNPSAVYTAADLSGSSDPYILQSLVASLDCNCVYAGYEAPDGSAARIAVLAMDSNGVLSTASSVALIGSSRLSALAVSPDGTYLYAVDKDHLYAYSRDPATGALGSSPQQLTNGGSVDGLAGAWAIVVSPDNHYIYVSGTDNNAVAVFKRDASGQLAFAAVYRDGVGGVSGLAGPLGMALSPDADGGQLYVAAAGDNAISVFSRDPASGALQFVHTYQDGTPGFDGLSGAAALTISPEGSQLYVLGSGEDALTVMRRDTVDGALTQVAVLRQGQGAPVINGLSSAFSLAATSDGKQLLVTSPMENSLAVFGVAKADINMVMQATSTTLTAGTSGQFQLIVTNNGPDSASGITVTDMLPAGVGEASGTFVQSSCSQDSAQLHCDVGTLDPGQHLAIAASIKFLSEGTYINSAVAAADQRDPAPTDNRDQVPLQIDPSLNQPPVAEPDQATTLPNVAVDIAVLANDHDPESNTITLSAVPLVSQQGAALSIDGGSVHYIPAGGFHGLDTFSYTIADSEGATAQGTVQVEVNTPPDAKDDKVSVVEGSPATIYVLVNDSDADGDTLNVRAVQTASDQGGTVGINGGGSVSYTPPAGYSGADSFTYTVDDGNGGNDTAQVSLSVVATVPQGSTSGAPSKESGQSTGGGGGSLDYGELLLLAMTAAATRGRRLMISRCSGMRSE